MFTEELAYQMGLISILFLVLLQHLVAQIVPSALVKGLILLVIELFFQWFAISSISDAGSSLGTVGTLGLMVSHFLMTPEVPYGIGKGIQEALRTRKNKVSKLIDDDSELESNLLTQAGKYAAQGTHIATDVLLAVAPKIVAGQVRATDGSKNDEMVRNKEEKAATAIQRLIRSKKDNLLSAQTSFKLRIKKTKPDRSCAPSSSASHAADTI